MLKICMLAIMMISCAAGAWADYQTKQKLAVGVENLLVWKDQGMAVQFIPGKSDSQKIALTLHFNEKGAPGDQFALIFRTWKENEKKPLPDHVVCVEYQQKLTIISNTLPAKGRMEIIVHPITVSRDPGKKTGGFIRLNAATASFVPDDLAETPSRSNHTRPPRVKKIGSTINGKRSEASEASVSLEASSTVSRSTTLSYSAESQTDIPWEQQTGPTATWNSSDPAIIEATQTVRGPYTFDLIVVSGSGFAKCDFYLKHYIYDAGTDSFSVSYRDGIAVVNALPNQEYKLSFSLDNGNDADFFTIEMNSQDDVSLAGSGNSTNNKRTTCYIRH